MGAGVLLDGRLAGPAKIRVLSVSDAKCSEDMSRFDFLTKKSSLAYDALASSVAGLLEDQPGAVVFGVADDLLVALQDPQAHRETKADMVRSYCGSDVKEDEIALLQGLAEEVRDFRARQRPSDVQGRAGSSSLADDGDAAMTVLLEDAAEAEIAPSEGATRVARLSVHSLSEDIVLGDFSSRRRAFGVQDDRTPGSDMAEAQPTEDAIAGRASDREGLYVSLYGDGDPAPIPQQADTADGARQPMLPPRLAWSAGGSFDRVAIADHLRAADPSMEAVEVDAVVQELASAMKVVDAVARRSALLEILGYHHLPLVDMLSSTDDVHPSPAPAAVVSSTHHQSHGLTFQTAVLPSATWTASREDRPELAEHSLRLADFLPEEGPREQASHRVVLPPGSFRETEEALDHVHVPAPQQPDFGAAERVVRVAEFPAWAQPAFSGVTELNRIQSRMYQHALFESKNLLLCAPTGSGKTNVAVLGILHEIGLWMKADARPFQVVYVAPMKALVSEMAHAFRQRLGAPYGLSVAELTGDDTMPRREIERTPIIVTTPEKWDVVTRKDGVFDGTTLLILDEVHLLHDFERGSVLESLVARTVRRTEETGRLIRIIALSATLPNYRDVAIFLRADWFFFGPEFRPCRLSLDIFGIIEKRETRRMARLNDCLVSVLRSILAGNGESGNGDEPIEADHRRRRQILVFVHSRKDTVKTARFVLESLRCELISQESQTILASLLPRIRDPALRDVLALGVGVHHAGLPKSDRQFVEDLFADGHLRVLFSTATLAWGVNMPAHTVVIKGTGIYNPQSASWDQLGALDLLQMFGRAGRPQFESSGAGVLITTHEHMQHYLHVLVEQMPIESQLIRSLPSALNAEIVSRTVQTFQDAVSWLGYTYYFVRAMRSRPLYRVRDAESEDPRLVVHRMRLVRATVADLFRLGLVRLVSTEDGPRESTDRDTAALRLLAAGEEDQPFARLSSYRLEATGLGRISSFFYVKPTSIASFARALHLSPSRLRVPIAAFSDLLKVFSSSQEFSHMSVRREEKLELEKLHTRVPIPVKDPAEHPRAKVCILLQCYISRFPLQGYALASEMSYVSQNASRIFRAMMAVATEFCKNAALSVRLLELSKLVEWRMWGLWAAHSPLRQVCQSQEELEAVIAKSERAPKDAEIIHIASRLPRVSATVTVQPLLRSTVRLDVSVHLDRTRSGRKLGLLHPYEQFHVLVESHDGNYLLHREMLQIAIPKPMDAGRQPYLQVGKKEDEREGMGDSSAGGHKADAVALLSFAVGVLDPLPPYYCVRVVSDRFLGCEVCVPVAFRRISLPRRVPPATPVLGLHPFPSPVQFPPAVEEIGTEPSATGSFGRPLITLNPIQAQCAAVLYGTNASALVAAPPVAGKSTVLTDLTVGRWVADTVPGRQPSLSVLVAPTAVLVSQCAERLERLFVHRASVLSVTDMETAASTFQSFWKALRARAATADTASVAGVVVAVPAIWLSLSKNWATSRHTQSWMAAISLCILDDIHYLALDAIYEAFVVRLLHARQHIQRPDGVLPPCRIVGLSAPVANTRSLAKWLGVPDMDRNVLLFGHGTPRFSADCVVRLPDVDISFRSVDSTVVAERLLADVVRQRLRRSPASDVASPRLLLWCVDPQKWGRSLSRLVLPHSISLDDGEAHGPARNVLDHVRIDSMEDAWTFPHDAWANIEDVILLLAGSPDLRPPDVSLFALHRMIGGRDVRRVHVLCSSSRLPYLRSFLTEKLPPVESLLDQEFTGVLLSELCGGGLRSKEQAIQLLSFSYLFRRLTENPNFYGLFGGTGGDEDGGVGQSDAPIAAAAGSSRPAPSVGRGQAVAAQLVSEFLSELVDSCADELEQSHCVLPEDDMLLAPTAAGLVAARYDLAAGLVRILGESLSEQTRFRGFLQALCNCADEFSMVQRTNALRTSWMEEICDQAQVVLRRLPLHVGSDVVTAPSQILVLATLGCHLYRPANVHFSVDASLIFQALTMLHAAVDLLAAKEALFSAMAAMELCQMLAQGVVIGKGATLLQLPHFTPERVHFCESRGVHTIFDFIECPDDVRNGCLAGLRPAEVDNVAAFCNDFPLYQVDFSLVPPAGSDPTAASNTAGDVMRTLKVSLVRDCETDTDDVFLSHLHPTLRSRCSWGALPSASNASAVGETLPEGWWIVIGHKPSGRLLGIKRFLGLCRSNMTVSVDFWAPAADRTFAVLLISDVYVGADQEFEFSLTDPAQEGDLQQASTIR